MTLLYCFPPSEIKARYSRRNNLEFLDKNKIVSHIQGKIKEETLYKYPTHKYDLRGFDQHLLILKVRELGPIWSRWSGCGDRYELLIRDFSLRALGLAEQIKSRGISIAIFHTSINHHIDSSIVQIACSLANIPQIFLYHEPVGNRLLPMIQFQDVYDRKPLGCKISNYNAAADVNKFKYWALNNKPPEYNYTTRWVDKNFYINYSIALWMDIKTAVKKFKRYPSSTDQPLETFAVKKYIGQFQSQALVQRHALKVYESTIIDFNKLSDYVSENEKFYVIAAHHQPEATSFPEGGKYDNHIDIVMNIRSNGYIGPILYKEHPTIWNYSEGGLFSRVAIARSVAYYESLSALGVLFLNSNVSLQKISELFPSSRMVTITGTIALERAFRGQSTIVAGQPWYKNLPSTISINTHEDWCNESDFSDGGAAVSDAQSYIAGNFLIDLLSNKTISNVTGVGILKTEKSSAHLEIGLLEHDRFLEFVEENYVE